MIPNGIVIWISAVNTRVMHRESVIWKQRSLMRSDSCDLIAQIQNRDYTIKLYNFIVMFRTNRFIYNHITIFMFVSKLLVEIGSYELQGLLEIQF